MGHRVHRISYVHRIDPRTVATAALGSGSVDHFVVEVQAPGLGKGRHKLERPKFRLAGSQVKPVELAVPRNRIDDVPALVDCGCGVDGVWTEIEALVFGEDESKVRLQTTLPSWASNAKNVSELPAA